MVGLFSNPTLLCDTGLLHKKTPWYNRITTRQACFYSGNGGTATHDHKAAAWHYKSQSKDFFFVSLIATLYTLRHKHVNLYCFVVKSRFFQSSTAHTNCPSLRIDLEGATFRHVPNCPQKSSLLETSVDQRATRQGKPVHRREKMECYIKVLRKRVYKTHYKRHVTMVRFRLT